LPLTGLEGTYAVTSTTPGLGDEILHHWGGRVHGREAVGILSARTAMWEMEALHPWLLMVPSHFRTEIAPI
jgi:hypothetical protein